MRDVVICGVGMTRFAKQLERTLGDLVSEAVDAALADAGVGALEVDEVYFSSAITASVTGQEMVAGQVALRPSALRGLPIINVENACASASTALHLGFRAVASGMVDTVLCVGAEKMTHADKQRSLIALGRAADVAEIFGEAGPQPGGRSWFMDNYAAEALRYMERSDATPHDFAVVAAKNHANGALNPRAQYGGTMTAEEVLAQREIVYPLTLSMCSPVSDGAAAVVLRAAERAGDGPRVRIAASVVRSGSVEADADSGSKRAALAAYEQAGLGPDDLDLVELHDATAPAEVELYETLGFAPDGDGAALIREGRTARDGALPVNVSGGLLAKGHPVGATGLAQAVEATLHLRGHAGDRQVDGARVALTHNAGGWIGHDNAAAAVHILRREDA